MKEILLTTAHFVLMIFIAIVLWRILKVLELALFM